MPRALQTDESEGELCAEDRDKLIDQLARKIVGKGLETPAILFLEMHKPISFLAGQTMLVASPLLAPVIGFDGVQRYSALFGTRDNVELLIRRIEDLAGESQ